MRKHKPLVCTTAVFWGLFCDLAITRIHNTLVTRQFSMERAAFKFTGEYMDVLGGKDSPMYEEFIVMFCKGLAAARKYATVTVTMMEIMMFQVSKLSVPGWSCAS